MCVIAVDNPMIIDQLKAELERYKRDNELLKAKLAEMTDRYEHKCKVAKAYYEIGMQAINERDDAQYELKQCIETCDQLAKERNELWRKLDEYNFADSVGDASRAADSNDNYTGIKRQTLKEYAEDIRRK